MEKNPDLATPTGPTMTQHLSALLDKVRAHRDPEGASNKDARNALAMTEALYALCKQEEARRQNRSAPPQQQQKEEPGDEHQEQRQERYQTKEEPGGEHQEQRQERHQTKEEPGEDTVVVTMSTSDYAALAEEMDNTNRMIAQHVFDALAIPEQAVSVTTQDELVCAVSALRKMFDMARRAAQTWTIFVTAVKHLDVPRPAGEASPTSIAYPSVHVLRDFCPRISTPSDLDPATVARIRDLLVEHEPTKLDEAGKDNKNGGASKNMPWATNVLVVQCLEDLPFLFKGAFEAPMPDMLVFSTCKPGIFDAHDNRARDARWRRMQHKRQQIAAKAHVEMQEKTAWRKRALLCSSSSSPAEDSAAEEANPSSAAEKTKTRTKKNSKRKKQKKKKKKKKWRRKRTSKKKTTPPPVLCADECKIAEGAAAASGADDDDDDDNDNVPIARMGRRRQEPQSQGDHQAQLNEHRLLIDELRRELATKLEQTNQALVDERAQHRAALQSWKTRYRNSLDANKALEQRLGQLEAQHAAHLDRMRAERARAIDAEFQRGAAHAQAVIDDKIATLRKELEDKTRAVVRLKQTTETCMAQTSKANRNLALAHATTKVLQQQLDALKVNNKTLTAQQQQQQQQNAPRLSSAATKALQDDLARSRGALERQVLEMQNLQADHRALKHKCSRLEQVLAETTQSPRVVVPSLHHNPPASQRAPAQHPHAHYRPTGAVYQDGMFVGYHYEPMMM